MASRPVDAWATMVMSLWLLMMAAIPLPEEWMIVNAEDPDLALAVHD
jgi:hypothetical protein